MCLYLFCVFVFSIVEVLLCAIRKYLLCVKKKSFIGLFDNANFITNLVIQTVKKIKIKIDRLTR
jgi:hypothetical protein